MPTEVILPKVDMDMTHGTLAVWHVAEGETVVKGAALFDIETDKAAMEVEAPATGRLHGVTAGPGDKVAVGTVVALIYADGESVAPAPALISAAAPTPPPAPAPIAEIAPTPAPVAPALPQTPDLPTGPRATPAARAGARRLSADLGQIPGSGPLGRIQRADVEAWAESQTTAPEGKAVWAPQPGPLHIGTRKGAGIPLLLLHGFTADSQSWAPLEKALGRERALIRIDLPGHGRSPRRRVASFADMAKMLVEAFDDAASDHDKVHLLGHSLGGALALALADIRPRRIASLSLIAPAGLGPEIDADSLAGITRASRVESLAPWLRRLTATPEGISDDYAKAAMRLRADPALRACQAELAQVLFPDGVQAFDLAAAFSRLVCPTNLIWGRSDHILPWRQATSAPGDFALHLLAGAGHIPQIECPDRVARILLRTLGAPPQPD